MNVSLRAAVLLTAAALPLAGCKSSDKHVEPGPGGYDGPFIPNDDFHDPGHDGYESPKPLLPIPKTDTPGRPLKAPPAPAASEPNGGGGRPVLPPPPSAQRVGQRRFLATRTRPPVRQVGAEVRANRPERGPNPVQLEGIEFVEVLDESDSDALVIDPSPRPAPRPVLVVE